MTPPAAQPTTATILVTCPDRRGIVAALAQVLHGHGANILDSDQHTDVLAAKFFQRIRFDCAELTTDSGTLESRYFAFLSLMSPKRVNSQPFLALRVGITQSNMSMPRSTA